MVTDFELVFLAQQVIVNTSPDCRMKTLEDLNASRDLRAAIVHELGLVPESILVYDRNVQSIDIMAERRSYGSTAWEPDQEFEAATPTNVMNHLRQAFDVSKQGARLGALSRFPQNVGRILLRLFSKAGDTVVDPFAGHNSRMELCWRNGRHYIGHDLSREFMIANRKIADLLEVEKNGDLFGADHYQATITLHECDSRRMPTPDCIGDFTITSPPYWDLEDYGPEPEQLGKRGYEEFLTELGAVARENHRCLKPGAYAIWCVNDFRKEGRFFPYHEHTAQILRDAGFLHHDTLITDLGPPSTMAYAKRILTHKIIPKRHEFCLVFRRPFANEKTNLASTLPQFPPAPPPPQPEFPW